MTISQVIPKEETVIEPETGEKPVIKVPHPQLVYETEKTIEISLKS